MFPGVPADQGEGLENSTLEPGPVDRKKVGGQEGAEDVQELSLFAHCPRIHFLI